MSLLAIALLVWLGWWIVVIAIACLAMKLYDALTRKRRTDERPPPTSIEPPVARTIPELERLLNVPWPHERHYA